MYDKQKIEDLKDAIASMAVEAWRFRLVFESAVKKLGPSEADKYLSKYSWFQRKVNDALSTAEMRFVNLEGAEYIDGLARWRSQESLSFQA